MDQDKTSLTARERIESGTIPERDVGPALACLARIEELEREKRRIERQITEAKDCLKRLMNDATA